MDASLIVLKLFLDELGVGTEIDTVDKRKLVQKAVYLGQLSGADLGYRFGWYLKGPYCTDLTEDYYRLADAWELEGDVLADKQLHPALRKQLQNIRPLLDTPLDVGLAPPEWLELLASVHFLQRISRMTPEQARVEIQKRKSHLSEWFDEAQAHLKHFDLLN